MAAAKQVLLGNVIVGGKQYDKGTPVAEVPFNAEAEDEQERFKRLGLLGGTKDLPEDDSDKD